MAKPIKDTPILTGKDAKKFSEKVELNEKKEISASEYQKLLASYNKYTLK
jgi:hypothetical protein